MATLKEVVESGRRWRFVGMLSWLGPGHHVDLAEWSTNDVLSDNFEIEPEPERPREWVLHEGCWHTGNTCFWCQKGEWAVRVHDADACDRLEAKP